MDTLTSSDLTLLIPLVFFALYSMWVTTEAVSYKKKLDIEERSHEKTQDYFEKEQRKSRTLTKALQFYALDENWDSNPNKSGPSAYSKISSDQGKTAQLAIGDFFLSLRAKRET